MKRCTTLATLAVSALYLPGCASLYKITPPLSGDVPIVKSHLTVPALDIGVTGQWHFSIGTTWTLEVWHPRYEWKAETDEDNSAG